MTPRPLFTHVHGARIHAELCGDLASDPSPVVLLHGLGVSSRYFRPLAERLARDRLVLALDLPGTGRSESPDHTLSIAELSDALDGWLRTLGLGRVTLVGHSFGCQVAADFAVKRPQRVDRLVLIAPTVDPTWPTVRKQLPRWVLEATRETVRIFPILFTDLVRFGLRRFWRTARAALAHDLVRLLAKVRAETLVLRGARDPFVSDGWFLRVASLLPRATTAEIPGAAHCVQLSAPGAVASLIHSFLTRVISSPQPTLELENRA